MKRNDVERKYDKALEVHEQELENWWAEPDFYKQKVKQAEADIERWFREDQAIHEKIQSDKIEPWVPPGPGPGGQKRLADRPDFFIPVEPLRPDRIRFPGEMIDEKRLGGGYSPRSDGPKRRGRSPEMDPERKAAREYRTRSPSPESKVGCKGVSNEIAESGVEGRLQGSIARDRRVRSRR